MIEINGLITDAYLAIGHAQDALASVIQKHRDDIQCQVQKIDAPKASDVDERSSLVVENLSGTVDSLIAALTDVGAETDQNRKYSKRYPGLARVPAPVITAAHALNGAKSNFVATLDEVLPTKGVKTSSASRIARQRALKNILPPDIDRRALERRIHIIECDVHRLMIRWGKNPRSSVALDYDQVQTLIDEAPKPENDKLDAHARRMDALRCQCQDAHKAGWQFRRFFISRSAAPRISYAKLDDSLRNNIAQNIATPALILDTTMTDSEFQYLCKGTQLDSLDLMSKEQINEFKPTGPTSIPKDNLYFQGLHILYKKTEHTT